MWLHQAKYEFNSLQLTVGIATVSGRSRESHNSLDSGIIDETSVENGDRRLANTKIEESPGEDTESYKGKTIKFADDTKDIDEFFSSESTSQDHLDTHHFLSHSANGSLANDSSDRHSMGEDDPISMGDIKVIHGKTTPEQTNSDTQQSTFL